MINARRKALIISIVLFLHTITMSNGKHHRQQCSTAWSSVQANFKFNRTASTNLNSNATQNTTSLSRQNQTLTVNIIGIPWSYTGKPIESTSAPRDQLVSLTIPTSSTGETHFIPPDQWGYPCIDAGVLYSCLNCRKILTGQDCYKKIGSDQLDTVSSGDIKCDRWYSRTGYGEGGGVTMCGAHSGDVFQCSSDKGISKCYPCLELGTTSP